MKAFIFIFCLFGFICSLPSFANPVQPQESTKQDSVPCKIIDFSFKWQKRKKAAFATAVNIAPNTRVTSNCLKFINLGQHPIKLTTEHNVLASINQQAFTRFPITIHDNDSLVIKTQSASNYRKNSYYSMAVVETNPQAQTKNTGKIYWNIQTALKSRKPEVWLVGPNSQHKTIKAIISLLAPGDKILLEGNHTYKAIDIRGISGTPTMPIELIGVAVKGKRPVITGAGSKYNWALSLRNSHHWRITNLELAQAGICYRHESAFIQISKLLMHQCGNGILGTDFHSGSLHVSNTEIRESGGKEENKNWKHGIYMSTDRDRFPNSVFTLTKSFLHNNKGNTVKSRAERAEIYNNWIENSELNQSIYALELIGYEEYEALPEINHDVVGNVIIIKSDSHAIRVGGDNTGSSNGASRFASNVFLFTNQYKRHIFRLNGQLKSLNINDNLFLNQQEFHAKVNLIKDAIPLKDWYHATPHINVTGNHMSFDYAAYRSESQNSLSLFDEELAHLVIKNNKNINQLQLKRYLDNDNITPYAFDFIERIATPLSNLPSPYYFKTVDNLTIHNKPIPNHIPFYGF